MKSKNKKLPLELLVDIFEGIDGEIIGLSKVFKKQKSMGEQKECVKLWVNRINILLTSSSIIYLFIGENCQEIWSLILEEREFVEKIERLKEEEQLLEERVDLLEDETCELRKQIAKLFEEKRKKLNEKHTKRLEKNKTKIAKQRKAEKEMEENSPVAKRTRSHFSSKEIKK
uniref:Candidate secreted effector n=1 Tax=Meloidogyne incognita TaxID=6306 RepID=A0A914MAP2_MELIC